LRFFELPGIAARTAGAFGRIGVNSGDTVALLLTNRIEFVETVWAQAWRGGLAIPVNPALRGTSLAHVLNDGGARVLVCGAELLDRVFEVRDALDTLERIVVVGRSDMVVDPLLPTTAWNTFVSGAEHLPCEEPRFDDPALVVYTSGTTGRAKGVVISHHHAFCLAALAADNMEWGPGDHLFTPLPLCHVQAHLAVLLAGLVCGAEVTVAEKFSATRLWKQLAACGATSVNLGPTVAIVAKQPPGEFDAAHTVRTVIANPPPADIPGFESRFGTKVHYQGYGMTEGYFNPRMRNEVTRARNCVGRPAPTIELEIVDEDDIVMTHDGSSVGEIVVRAKLPSVMITRYHNNPRATAEAFRGLWFHTGDLGSIDPDGFVYLHGRKTDSMRRRGENISAVEIESEALAHPAIAEAAAFGVPSGLGDDDVKLDIVLAPGASLDIPDLIDHLRTRLAPYMMPRYIQKRAHMPMTATAKIEKYRLRAAGAGGADYDAGERSTTGGS
jgi:crotonobetaine/carnitine-CoA ligase